MKKIAAYLIVIFFFAATIDAVAQCSMCKATVESNIKSNANFKGKGLNHGILYLMSIPYLLGGVAALIYFKNRKRKAITENLISQ